MSRKVSVAWPALKMAAIKLYDHLGIAMLLSLLWLAIGVTPLIFVLPMMMEAWLFGGLLLVLTGALLFMPATSATFAACRMLLAREDVGARTFFRAFGKNYKRSFLVGIVDGCLFLVLIVDLLFVFNTSNRFFQFMGGIWVWFGVFLVLLQIYLIPLLLAGNNLKDIFKKAAILVMDNLGSTFALVLETLAVLLVCLFVPLLLDVPPLLVLFFLFFPVMIGFFHLGAYDIIMTKYDDEEDPNAA